MDKALLNYKMEQAEVTNIELARVLGISVVTLYRKKMGLNEFNRAEIQKIMERLSLTMEEKDQIFFN